MLKSVLISLSLLSTIYGCRSQDEESAASKPSQSEDLQAEDYKAPDPKEVGACAAVAEATNNVEECKDNITRKTCEATVFAEYWPNSNASGINPNAKLSFVAKRKCESFGFRTGIK